MSSPAPARGRQVTVTQAAALLLAFVATAVVGGLLVAGLALPAVAAVKTTTDLSEQAFEGLPSELAAKPPSQTSRMLAADGSLLAEFYDQNREIVTLDQIAPVMQQAVVSIEDRRFYEHGGIDPMGMARAVIRNAQGNTQGASTLTQQYVKNVLLDAAIAADDTEAMEAATTAKGGEGLARKLREAKLAISLEQQMTKDQILEGYLNIAQFGVNLYGVQTAAHRYFGVEAKDLTYLQAATIAGVTQSPTALDPIRNPEESQKRRNQVLAALLRDKHITQAEYDAGVATPLADTLNVQPLQLGCMAADLSVPGSGFFCDYVVSVIRTDPAFGETAAEREELLYRGGLTISTTLIPSEQTVADAEVKAGVPVDDGSGVASSIVTVEPGTGKITSMAQNRVYNPSEEHGERETGVNYNTDFEHGGSGGFAPGSTFKPFTLLEWLKQGHALMEVVDGRLRPYKMSEFTTSCAGLSGPDYKFGNSEGNAGFMTVADATRNSVNSGYIAMGSQLDLCNIMTGAQQLGVTKAKADDTTGSKDLDPFPSNIIGVNSVSPLSMAEAFATFASGGVHCDAIAITGVIDAEGNALTVPSADCTQAIEPKIANAMNEALSRVWTGTARSLGATPYASAGKTGTTTYNEYTWFVGYTPLRATAVWVGYTDALTPVRKVWIKGKYYDKVFGSDVAAPTWKRFMNQVMAGQDVPRFAAADAEQVFGPQVEVPTVIGMTPADATIVLEEQGFHVKMADAPVDSAVPAGLVAEQTPTGQVSRGTVITLTLSTGIDPNPPEVEQEGWQGWPGTGAGGGTGTGTGTGSGSGSGTGTGTGRGTGTGTGTGTGGRP